MTEGLAQSPRYAVATLELAQAIVRLDTTNPPGNESRAADLILAPLTSLRLDVERHRLAPPVVIIGPGDPALSHQDNERCSVDEIWRSSLDLPTSGARVALHE